MAKNNLARALHDLGLAGWFGGTLMGAVGLHAAAASAENPEERTRLAGVGWRTFQPVQVAAIGAHLVGSALLLINNKSRLALQAGVGRDATVKTALTVAGLGATFAAAKVGREIQATAADKPTAGVTEATAETPPAARAAQQKEKVLQWVVPAVTGALIVWTAAMSEQERTNQVVRGALKRLVGT